MNKPPIKVVLHNAYGRFHLTREMVDLMKTKGFDFAKYNILEEHLKKSYEGNIYLTNSYDFEFRSDPILVEVVEGLQDAIKDETSIYGFKPPYISKLKIVEIYPPTIYIEEYDSGHERIKCGYEL
jgi:hypothetical protein